MTQFVKVARMTTRGLSSSSLIILSNHLIEVPSFWQKNCSKSVQFTQPSGMTVLSATVKLRVTRIGYFDPIFQQWQELDHYLGGVSVTIDDQEVVIIQGPHVGEVAESDASLFFQSPGTHRVFSCCWKPYGDGMLLKMWVDVWMEYTFEGDNFTPPKESPPSDWTAYLPWIAVGVVAVVAFMVLIGGRQPTILVVPSGYKAAEA